MSTIQATEVCGIRELTPEEIDLVHGGDSWAGTPEGREPARDMKDCANAILFWSGIGAAVGGYGGPLSAIGGFAIGGGIAAKYTTVCSNDR